MSLLTKAVTRILALLFPKICISCSREGSHCCEDCLGTVTLNRTPHPSPHPSLRGVHVVTPSQDPLITKALQYYTKPPFLRDLAAQFAFLIISYFIHSDNEAMLRDSTLVALPPTQEKWRGFDPAYLIAQELRSSLNLPLLPVSRAHKGRVLLVSTAYDSLIEDAATQLTKQGVQEVWGVVIAKNT